MVPGSYDVHVLGVDGHATVAPGMTQTLNLPTPVVIRGNIVVKPPTRDFPNAVAPAPVIVGMNGPGRNNVSVDLAAARNLKVVGYSDVANNGYAKLGGRTLALTLHGGQTLTLPIGRVDMDDVVVTREDGTTVKVRGTYTVTCTDDNVRLGPFATSTGVDVLPGKYRVDLTYTTALGVQTKSYTIGL